MKIIYLSSPITSQYGGGEKFLDDFTTGIDAQHEFIGGSKAVYDLFTSKGYNATLTSGLFEPVSPKNLLLFPISALVGIFMFIRFYKTFKNSDWIVSPTAHCETFFIISWIKIFLRKPVLFMVHAPKVPKLFSIPPLNLLLSKCWGTSPVVFVSNSQKELWNRAGCFSSNQIVIYNGVKVSDFDIFPLAQDDEHLDLVKFKDKVLKIGFLARLHVEKGCDTLIKALTSIKSTQNIKIIIAGDGPEKDNLMALYEVEKIPHNISVTFVGFQSETKNFYESLDLLVFPSRREGFSLVLLEAWERGLSVLTSDIQPFIEAKNFQNELEQKLIFQMDNTLDLASKIDYFIENQSVYLDSGYKKCLHDTILDKFGLQRMVSEYKKVLKM
jgi:glycosyltransferase involved in cell wall biosynthesis